MLDKRMTQIIKKIFESSYVSQDDLIKGCSLTKRQLDYSIEKINNWLDDNSIEPIRFVDSTITIQTETYHFLLQSMGTEKEIGLDTYNLSNHERTKYLFLLLIVSPKYLSINYFISQLRVSKSSIVKDLKILEIELEKYDIKILYSRKQGYYLSGDEGQIRYVLMLLVMTCVSIDNNNQLLDLFLKQNQLEPLDQVFEFIVKLAYV